MIQKLHQLIKIQTNLSFQETCWLLEHVTKKSHAELMLTKQLTDQEMADLDSTIAQLKDHKPLAYILGFVPFLDLKMQVKPPILIPRHETEEWVAKLIETLKPFASQIKKICDIGTGSGCIALALAKNFPDAKVTAIDINQQVLDLAVSNAKLHGIKNISFLKSDLFDELPKNAKFDLIVSNPPYIDPACAPTLPAQVSAWEDHQALFASDSGLYIITKLLQNAPKFLQKKSTLPVQLILEIGHDQHEKVLKLAKTVGWQAQALKDSFDKWRTIWLSQPSLTLRRVKSEI
ncbi:protein-(glutamine-N5) methyltransferase, release factor-specific [candidate division TM6 bacterium RIFCSPHIGHO2_12_FULL_38_8]|nr:MAG: protein-(glutamine-N5) methyltransferase, release factor-specific [candidate division TM6 bacterium RIFCSPHIGHO2_12_FULL_38_8]